jgi:hypothetical protein
MPVPACDSDSDVIFKLGALAVRPVGLLIIKIAPSSRAPGCRAVMIVDDLMTPIFLSRSSEKSVHIRLHPSLRKLRLLHPMYYHLRNLNRH